MTKKVVLIREAVATPATMLLDVLRDAGVGIMVEMLDNAGGTVVSAQAYFNDDTRESEQPIAILYEVKAGASIEQLHAASLHAATIRPAVPLVACRRPQSEPSRRRLRLFDNTTLKRLGFHAVADDPAQLPALLRKLEERGLTGDLLPPRDQADDETTETALLLPKSIESEALRAAFDLVASLHFANDQKSAANTVLAGYAALVEAHRWTIYLTSEMSGAEAAGLEPLAVRGLTESDRAIPATDWRRAFLGEAIAMSGYESEAARLAVATADTVNQSEHAHHVLAVPLVSAQRTLGVIEAVREGEDLSAFKESEVEIVGALAFPVASALANSVRIAEAERLSQTDDLTKLHNARYLRQYLLNEVRRARRYTSSVTVLFLDIDDFKRINDEHGHLVGSHVLMEMAMIILSSVRDTDVVARYGGDEFVIVLPETDLEMAAIVAERVREKIEGHAFTGGRRLELALTASFGVANFPEHAQSPQQLVAYADSAMYEAKASNKNCIRFAGLSQMQSLKDKKAAS